MSKGIKLDKVKVGDILYYNGPGECEVLVIERYDHNDWVDVLEHNYLRNTVYGGDDEVTRKPVKHVVYYPIHLDTAVDELNRRLVDYITHSTKTIELVKAAINV